MVPRSGNAEDSRQISEEDGANPRRRAVRARRTEVPVDDDDRYQNGQDVHDEREQQVLGNCFQFSRAHSSVHRVHSGGRTSPCASSIVHIHSSVGFGQNWTTKVTRISSRYLAISGMLFPVSMAHSSMFHSEQRHPVHPRPLRKFAGT